MSEVQYPEKFIAFFDVLGWESLVRASEEGRGLSLQELSEILTALGYGPAICLDAPRIRKDMDFRISSASDSVLISAEVSPAGLINLVSHCWTACFKLLSKGVMCRGYIKRGRIYHTPEQQIGTGLNDVVEWEKHHVSVFKKDAGERGTPFIEVDKEVVQYVAHQPDQCVKEMFSSLVKKRRMTLSPFSHSSASIPAFSSVPDWARGSIREGTRTDQCRSRLDTQDEGTGATPHRSVGRICTSKGSHYIRMLDDQLVACDQMDDAINLLAQPFPPAKGVFE